MTHPPQIAQVPAEKQKETYQRAVKLGNGKPTETTVKKAVEEVLKEAESATEIHRDGTGYAIPDEILDLWNRQSEIKELLVEISKARSAMRAAMDSKDPLFWPSNVSGAFVNLSAAYNTIQVSMPYAVCPTCQGRARDTCTLCKGRGFISKFLFDTVVPEELIAIRAKSCLL